MPLGLHQRLLLRRVEKVVSSRQVQEGLLQGEPIIISVIHAITAVIILILTIWASALPLDLGSSQSPFPPVAFTVTHTRGLVSQFALGRPNPSG
jgi:hypothetical protein